MLAEIGRSIAKDNSVPVNCSPAQHPNSIDADGIRIFVANGTADVARIEEFLLFTAEAAILKVIRPTVRAEAVRPDFLACFQQNHLRACLAQRFCNDAARGSGTDNADVVGNRRHRNNMLSRPGVHLAGCKVYGSKSTLAVSTPKSHLGCSGTGIGRWGRLIDSDHASFLKIAL